MIYFRVFKLHSDIFSTLIFSMSKPFSNFLERFTNICSFGHRDLDHCTKDSSDCQPGD